MKRFLFLGGGGVFANHVIKYFLEKDVEKVIAVGRSPRLPERYNLNVGKDDNRYEYKKVHIVFETEKLFKIFDEYEPECVINFAALAYANSWYNPDLFYNTNVVAVAKITQYLSKKKYFKHFCQVGTSEMYGTANKKGSSEDDPINATSPYAISKLAADLHLLSLHHVMNFPMQIVRPSNCYGTGQYTYRIIPKAILYLLNNKPFPLEGGGMSEKSFLYVTDLARGMFDVIKKGTLGEIYNIGSDSPISMKDIVLEICKQLNKDPKKSIVITEGRVGEDRKYWLDSSKIKKELNWSPKISFEEGISKMIKWCKKYEKELLKDPDYFVLKP